MTPTEISNGLAAIEKRISDMGYVSPVACAHFNFIDNGEGFCLNIEMKSDRNAERECEYFRSKASDAAVMFHKANAFLDDLPSVDDKRKSDFLRSLAGVIEQGRSAGVDVEFINPLEAAMKSLSENIITYQPVATDAVDLPF